MRPTNIVKALTDSVNKRTNEIFERSVFEYSVFEYSVTFHLVSDLLEDLLDGVVGFLGLGGRLALPVVVVFEVPVVVGIVAFRLLGRLLFLRRLRRHRRDVVVRLAGSLHARLPPQPMQEKPAHLDVSSI